MTIKHRACARSPKPLMGYSNWTFVVAALLLLVTDSAFAQRIVGGPVQQVTLPSINPAPSTARTQAPSLLNMPLMSVEQGQRFQSERQVSASNVIVKTPARSASSTPQAVSSVSASAVKPVLGHALPTSTKTPLGFPRADFAIGSASPSATIQRTSQSASPSAANQEVIR